MNTWVCFIETVSASISVRSGIHPSSDRASRHTGVAQYNPWMIEHAALGKPYECFVTEETKCPVIYFKDAAICIDLLYQAPREKIKSLNYNVAGVTLVQTAKELEMVIKKFVSGFQVTYKPDHKVMEFFRNFNVEVYDDGRARKESG